VWEGGDASEGVPVLLPVLGPQLLFTRLPSLRLERAAHGMPALGLGFEAKPHYYYCTLLYSTVLYQRMAELQFLCLPSV